MKSKIIHQGHTLSAKMRNSMHLTQKNYCSLSFVVFFSPLHNVFPVMNIAGFIYEYAAEYFLLINLRQMMTENIYS